MSIIHGMKIGFVDWLGLLLWDRWGRRRGVTNRSIFPHVHKVIGNDEAGRGPLAGPVVTVVVWALMDVDGIVESKQITKEEEPERL